MNRVAMLLALIGCTARIAVAHIVPIPPSLCAFDPLTLEQPATGLVGAAQPAGVADEVRTAYDTGVSQIQVCPAVADSHQCGAIVPRAFTFGNATGTLAFPAIFPGRMLSSGDITIDALPVTFAVGTTTATVDVTFTTGLLAMGDRIVEGTPLQGLQSFTLVGLVVGDALPPPLGGSPVLMKMSCQPRPVPDKDQFALASTIGPIEGRLAQPREHLRATVVLFSASAPDLAGRRIVLAVHVDGQTVATAVFSAGLHGTRRLTATSDDGNAVLGVRQSSVPQFIVTGSRQTFASHLVVAARLRGVVLPPQSPGGRVLVDVTLDVGGLLGRGEQLFHVARNGRKLHAR